MGSCFSSPKASAGSGSYDYRDYSKPVSYSPGNYTSSGSAGYGTYSSPVSYGYGNYRVTSSGINSQGNYHSSRDYGPNVRNTNAYHYQNKDGSSYYNNPDGSTYYNNGRGYSKYTPPQN